MAKQQAPAGHVRQQNFIKMVQQKPQAPVKVQTDTSKKK